MDLNAVCVVLVLGVIYAGRKVVALSVGVIVEGSSASHALTTSSLIKAEKCTAESNVRHLKLSSLVTMALRMTVGRRFSRALESVQLFVTP
mmetsp:Transcript_12924/g.31679  ORF Transcript_12924/g.31679 Transcript_12924/m.31679 type:complete len:91 (+) Transcript_12924:336-608(+)